MSGIKMNFLNKPAIKNNDDNTVLSPVLGSAWQYDKCISIVMGKKTRAIKGDKNSELVEVFESFEVKPGAKLVLFPNRYKKDDKHPDYTVHAKIEKDDSDDDIVIDNEMSNA